MSNWVLSSNPATTYRAAESLCTNDNVMDWISKNDFKIGDVVYIYEALPPNGRGGLVYKTEVTNTGITLDNKIDDREFWFGESYPEYITDKTIFNKLEVIGIPLSGIISYQILKGRGFIAPQVGAHLLDGKPKLLQFIQEQFE